MNCAMRPENWLEQFGVVAAHRLLPVLDHLGDLLVEFENAVGVDFDVAISVDM